MSAESVQALPVHSAKPCLARRIRQPMLEVPCGRAQQRRARFWPVPYLPFKSRNELLQSLSVTSLYAACVLPGNLFEALRTLREDHGQALMARFVRRLRALRIPNQMRNTYLLCILWAPHTNGVKSGRQERAPKASEKRHKRPVTHSLLRSSECFNTVFFYRKLLPYRRCNKNEI